MRWLLLLLLSSLFLAGCDDFEGPERPAPEEVEMCSADVMVCPDGSFVSRDAENDCDFYPCPDGGFGDPANEWGESS